MTTPDDCPRAVLRRRAPRDHRQAGLPGHLALTVLVLGERRGPAEALAAEERDAWAVRDRRQLGRRRREDRARLPDLARRRLAGLEEQSAGASDRFALLL